MTADHANWKLIQPVQTSATPPSCVLDFATAGIRAYTSINCQALNMHALTMHTPQNEI